MHVSPNPASDEIRLQLSEPLPNAATIELISMKGAVVERYRLESGQDLRLDVGSVPARCIRDHLVEWGCQSLNERVSR